MHKKRLENVDSIFKGIIPFVLILLATSLYTFFIEKSGDSGRLVRVCLNLITVATWIFCKKLGFIKIRKWLITIWFFLYTAT